MKLLVFMAFVIFYSVFLCCILVSKPGTITESKNQTNKTINQEATYSTIQSKISSNDSQKEDFQSFENKFVRMIGSINHDGVTAIKIMLGILTGILVLNELCQAYTIGIHYFQEMENYIEWLTIICAFVTVSLETLHRDSSAIARGFSAIGICLAYLELVFLIGRYPFQWSDVGIMFYRILTRLLRYVFALFLIIVGHTFAFMVNRHSVDAFKSPWKSYVETLTRYKQN